MKVGLWLIWEALIFSCVLSYSFNVEARLLRFNPNTIHPPQQRALHNNDEVSNHFRDTHMRRSWTMNNEQISIAPAENKFPSTLKVTLEGGLGHNHSHGIKKDETLVGGTQFFSKSPNESKNDSARMKKDVAVTAFRPSSSGHSPGMGHSNPPDPML